MMVVVVSGTVDVVTGELAAEDSSGVVVVVVVVVEEEGSAPAAHPAIRNSAIAAPTNWGRNLRIRDDLVVATASAMVFAMVVLVIAVVVAIAVAVVVATTVVVVIVIAAIPSIAGIARLSGLRLDFEIP